MKPEKARIKDVTSIHKMVNDFADRGLMLPRSLSDIYENIRDYFVMREGGETVACAALHVNWEDLAEIKSVAVAETFQHKGIGGAMIAACLKEAGELGLNMVFCLSYQPGFFEKCGFKQIDKSKLPHKVWGECYRCAKFPNCDEIALIYQPEV